MQSPIGDCYLSKNRIIWDNAYDVKQTFLREHHLSHHGGIRALKPNMITFFMLSVIRDMKNLIGEASCGICQESFSTTITGMFRGQIFCRSLLVYIQLSPAHLYNLYFSFWISCVKLKSKKCSTGYRTDEFQLILLFFCFCSFNRANWHVSKNIGLACLLTFSLSLSRTYSKVENLVQI